MPTRFRDTFGDRKVVLPVIHVEGVEQALRNTLLAREAGADGVFLIGHDLDWSDMLVVYQMAHKEHPDWFLGINLLDLKARRAMQFMGTYAVDALWADNARIEEWEEHQVYAKSVHHEREEWKGLYFGGVAFKHQLPVDNVAVAAKKAVPYMDVVTTSGPATGQAASVEKLRAMKEAIGDHPLAVASGVTVENVGEILPFVDAILVATGISKSFTELDAGKTKALVERVHLEPGSR